MSASKAAPLIVLALAATLGTGGVAAQEGDAPAEALPADAVARVDERVIERSRFRHWRRIAARDVGGDTTDRELRRQVMSFLISATWIELEAQRRGIRATARQVRRAFARQRRQAFESRRQYRRYLRRSGQTEEDLLYRVRIDLLSTKVRRDLLRGVEGTRRRQRRLDRFVVRFRERWRARTTCARGFKVPDCGSVSSAG